MDIMGKVFANYRSVYIVRNGAEWVKSKMNFGSMYNKGYLRSRISYSWPTPWDLENDPYQSHWSAMSRFEKICWAWTRLNEYAIQSVKKNPRVRVFKFEDIFKSEKRSEYLSDLVEFSTEIVDKSRIIKPDLTKMLGNKIHPSSGSFPDWLDWPDKYKKQFGEICGKLMVQLDYKLP